MGEIIAPIGLPIIKESDAYNITDVGITIRYTRLEKQLGKLKEKRGPKEKFPEWAVEQAHGLGADGVAANIARGLAKTTADITPTNVRESILRHADAANKNPKFVTKAYEKTQPVAIFQDDEATMKRKIKDSKKNEPAWKKLKTSGSSQI